MERLFGGICVLAIFGGLELWRLNTEAASGGDPTAKRRVRLAFLLVAAATVILVVYNSLT